MSASGFAREGDPVPEVEFRGGRNKRGGGDHDSPHARNLGGEDRRSSSEYGVRRSEYGFAQGGQNPDGEGQERTAAMRQQRRRRAQGWRFSNITFPIQI